MSIWPCGHLGIGGTPCPASATCGGAQRTFTWPDAVVPDQMLASLNPQGRYEKARTVISMMTAAPPDTSSFARTRFHPDSCAKSRFRAPTACDRSKLESRRVAALADAHRKQRTPQKLHFDEKSFEHSKDFTQPTRIFLPPGSARRA